jgi:hypothetical protein
MAAFTGDWSERRCELKPGPIVSMAMMIWVAFGGGGAVVSAVSVLCGAGGGLTVHPPTSTNDAATTAPRVIQSRRQAVGTPNRVSTARGRPALRADKLPQVSN